MKKETFQCCQNVEVQQEVLAIQWNKFQSCCSSLRGESDDHNCVDLGENSGKGKRGREVFVEASIGREGGKILGRRKQREGGREGGKLLGRRKQREGRVCGGKQRGGGKERRIWDGEAEEGKGEDRLVMKVMPLQRAS